MNATPRHSVAEELLDIRPVDVDELEFIRIGTPYVAVKSLVAGRRVLDVACGPGYGAFITALGRPATLSIADIDPDEIPPRALRSRLGAHAVRSDAQELPFRSNCSEVTLAFEVVEHVSHPERIIREIRRVTDDRGIAILSTPNRRLRLYPTERPWNPHHVREYTLNEFHGMLSSAFRDVQILGIQGRGQWQAVYEDRWRPSPRRYVRHMIRPAAVRFLGDRAVSLLARPFRSRAPWPPAPSALVFSPPDRIEHEDWPFYVTRDVRGALHFLAICGSADVTTNAEQIADEANGRLVVE